MKIHPLSAPISPIEAAQFTKRTQNSFIFNSNICGGSEFLEEDPKLEDRIMISNGPLPNESSMTARSIRSPCPTRPENEHKRITVCETNLGSY